MTRRLTFPAKQGHDGATIKPVLNYLVLYEEVAVDGRTTRRVYEHSSLESAIARARWFIDLFQRAGWRVRYLPSAELFICERPPRTNRAIASRRISVRASTLMIDTSKPLW